ncbi:UNVERIFIED_CONTAM: hypothetical protein FKN15_072636 [Acipenser sinensis]
MASTHFENMQGAKERPYGSTENSKTFPLAGILPRKLEDFSTGGNSAKPHSPTPSKEARRVVPRGPHLFQEIRERWEGLKAGQCSLRPEDRPEWFGRCCPSVTGYSPNTATRVHNQARSYGPSSLTRPAPQPIRERESTHTLFPTSPCHRHDRQADPTRLLPSTCSNTDVPNSQSRSPLL